MGYWIDLGDHGFGFKRSEQEVVIGRGSSKSLTCLRKTIFKGGLLKQMVIALRNDGHTFQDIADIFDIPVSSILDIYTAMNFDGDVMAYIPIESDDWSLTLPNNWFMTGVNEVGKCYWKLTITKLKSCYKPVTITIPHYVWVKEAFQKHLRDSEFVSMLFAFKGDEYTDNDYRRSLSRPEGLKKAKKSLTFGDLVAGDQFSLNGFEGSKLMKTMEYPFSENPNHMINAVGDIPNMNHEFHLDDSSEVTLIKKGNFNL